MRPSKDLEAVVYAQRGRSRRRRVLVRLGIPVRDRYGDYASRVKLGAIEPERKIFGVDPIQAMALASTFLKLRIDHLRARGWIFYFSKDSETPCDLLQLWFARSAWPRKWRK